MKKISTHENLDLWQLSIEFVTEIYRKTSEFPPNEKYGLVSQMRRAAVSIPSNIAEGAARNHTKEMIQFLYVSLGSIAELETQIEISMRLGLLNQDNDLLNKLIRLKMMTIKLIKALKIRTQGNK